MSSFHPAKKRVAWPETTTIGPFQAADRETATVSMADDTPPTGDSMDSDAPATQARGGLPDRVWIPLLSLALIGLLFAADGPFVSN